MARRDHAGAGAAPDPAQAGARTLAGSRVNARTSLNGEWRARDEHRRAVAAVDHDPVAAARDLAQLDGLSALRAMIAGALPPPPIATLLGFHLVEVDEGRVVFAAVPGPEHSRGHAPLRPAA